MKNSLRLLMLLAFLALSACNQKRPMERFNSREVPRGAGADLGVNPAAKLCGENCAWGKFYEDTASVDFETQVKRFASVSVPMEEIGTVDSNINGTETGVWFWGEMALQGGDLRTVALGQQQSLAVGANSRLAVVIYDSFSVQSGSELKPIVAYFVGNRTGYTVTGTITRVGTDLVGDIRFQDQWGAIRLKGTIQNVGGTLTSSTFTGDVSYMNSCSMTADGGCAGASQAPSETRLGKFAVEACRFFACQ